VKLAEAYGLPAYRAGDEAAFGAALEGALGDIAGGRAALIEALIGQDERVLPMVPGGRPIDDQVLEGT
jgi:acetolactate synthase-1/2/3 large subunit